jgi:hypothetical protein
VDPKHFENCTLKPRQGDELIETEIAYMWLEDSILHYVAKKLERNAENLTETFDAINKLTKGQKVCALAEMNDIQPYKNVPRQQSIGALEKYFKALAIITCTPVGRMISHIAVIRNFKEPIKVFTDPAEAKKWLEGFK